MAKTTAYIVGYNQPWTGVLQCLATNTTSWTKMLQRFRFTSVSAFLLVHYITIRMGVTPVIYMSFVSSLHPPVLSPVP